MPINLDQTLEKFGGILVGAFGDSVFIGVLFGLMEKITPYQCYEFIRDKKQLFPDVTDEDWVKIRRFAQRAKLGEIDTERIINEFRKHRPDLLSVMVNQPGGYDWLDGEVSRLKVKLGLT